jgi:cell division protein FtsN
MTLDPLIILVLMFYALMLAAALTVWFALTFRRQQRPKSVNDVASQAKPASQARVLQHIPQARPSEARQSAPRSRPKPPTAVPQAMTESSVMVPPRATARPKLSVPLSNDDVRGQKVKVHQHKRQPDQGESMDAFEKFLKAKNDDLRF